MYIYFIIFMTNKSVNSYVKYTYTVTHEKSAERWRTLTIARPSLCHRRVRLAIVVDRR